MCERYQGIQLPVVLKLLNYIPVIGDECIISPFGLESLRCLLHLLLECVPVLDPRCKRCLVGNSQRP